MSKAKFADTMIGSEDINKTAEFYKKFLGMTVSDAGDGESYLILKDERTSQTLLIVGDPQIKNAQPGIASENIERTLQELQDLGGKVKSRDTFPSMLVADVEDAEGRHMCIWQTL